MSEPPPQVALDTNLLVYTEGITLLARNAHEPAVARDLIAGLPAAGPQETAEMIMAFALSFDGEPRDDMTVLVGGIYGR